MTVICVIWSKSSGPRGDVHLLHPTQACSLLPWKDWQRGEGTWIEDLVTTVNTCFQLKTAEPISVCKTNWESQEVLRQIKKQSGPVLTKGTSGCCTLWKCHLKGGTVICHHDSQMIVAKLPSVPRFTVCFLTRRGTLHGWWHWRPRRSYPAWRQEGSDGNVGDALRHGANLSGRAELLPTDAEDT